ncbi:MAG: CPBP family intramembrane metalloprotease [Clostridiales bacterium]|nr:CPBP family intramembrane metalloprotease [Clostridiales bacterium]
METKKSFQKVWDVLQPFLIYYVLHFVIFILLTFLVQAALEGFGSDYGDYLTAHAATVTGLVSGLSMLLAVAPLIPMLKRELGERDRERAETEPGGLSWAMPVLTLVLAAASSLGLNVLFSLIGFAESSDTFREVTDRQFGVAFGVGVILYGLVSPLAEEIVFRGLLYNRMRKHYPLWAAVASSGLFFGLYHGNTVQAVYGCCMGILMAYLYERTGKFFIPLLFHGAANLSVYVTAYLPGLQERLFQAMNCVILLTISAACVIGAEKIAKSEKKSQ